MTCRIALVEFVGQKSKGGIYEDVPAGAFLKSYDPDAHGGIGDATWTLDPTRAMVFPDTAAAIRCYQSVSVLRPTRPDGRKNRPLTAATIVVVNLPEAT